MGLNPNDVSSSVRLPKELHARVTDLAGRDKKSKNKMIIELIELGFVVYEKKSAAEKRAGEKVMDQFDSISPQTEESDEGKEREATG